MKEDNVERVLAYGIWHGPTGCLGLVAEGERLLEIVSEPAADAVLEQIARRYPQARVQAAGVIAEALQQLDDYFHGRRRHFDLPLKMDRLPPFTAKVLRILAQVPYGTTLTYGELAALAGAPHAARAVGRAMATNPFPIVIPCHRVLVAGGRLGGYSGGGGIVTKEWLLRFEAEKSSSDA
jgi:methylated-DNA-[protein]-cysteine S-methyltransferase